MPSNKGKPPALDRYAVIGHPVSHSRSPQIHHAFGEQTDRSIEYGLLPSEPDAFVATVTAFRAEGGKGLNVTVPFKEEAAALADHLSERARIAGAANTLSFKTDGIHADNTDGAGLVNDLSQRWQQALPGSIVLLIGAGGAARGVLHPLLTAGVSEIWIANRTPSRARQLAELVSQDGSPVAVHAVALELDALTALHSKWQANSARLLIINATAAGLAGKTLPVPAALLQTALLCYDMVYSKEPTAFMQQASQAGCAQVVDGLGMLVEQAAESFAIWQGVRPQTEPVFKQLRYSTSG
ncbi:MAG: shikimate dehydrogenase [Burkholderiaceae bacterium]